MKKLFFLLCLFVAFSCSDDEDKEKEYVQPAQITLGGVIWNTKVYAEYCTIEEAEQIAAREGKRLPTHEEIKELAYMRTYDEGKKVLWVGENTSEKGTNCFPIKMYGYKMADKVHGKDHSVYLWNSEGYSSAFDREGKTGVSSAYFEGDYLTLLLVEK